MTAPVEKGGLQAAEVEGHEIVNAAFPEGSVMKAECLPQLRAVLEALVYITDEPLTASQIAAAVGRPVETVTQLLEEIASEFNKPEHGLTIREVAGGYKMATKPEYHEPIRAFVKNLKPPMKLSPTSHSAPYFSKEPTFIASLMR